MEKEKILIVDSDQDVRNTLIDCLSIEYEVITSPSFKLALKMLKEQSFNVLRCK